jgi:hypothetical protein
MRTLDPWVSLTRDLVITGEQLTLAAGPENSDASAKRRGRHVVLGRQSSDDERVRAI